ncbi:MAG TPA: glycosyltransferase family 2 protein [Acidimicrobiales bacterium]|nr:glycosyltransferase family 2 protein [Acidimicrobiales bacterium]
MNVGQKARLAALQRLVVDLGRDDFDRRYPDLAFTPVVALVCAYDEADNLGRVLEAMPAEACGLPVTALVVVDGGDDGTDKVAIDGGAVTFVLPVNLGHGVALRVGYQLCLDHGARYVVTLDADGQNDPAEMGALLAPVVDDAADVVVGSRRLGVDHTADRYRQAGVVWFSWLVNRLTGARLTDTSNGYRALRAAMLSDVAHRLRQDQYQTAELLITAISRGWRVAERPTVWHRRLSGRSKKGGNLLYGLRYAAVVLSTWWRER